MSISTTWARARRTLHLAASHPARRWVERIAWVALLAFVGMRLWPQLAAAAGIPSSNGQVPPFTVSTLDGSTVTAESLTGKVVLVNFWATWCPPCRVEMPGFQQAHERFGADGFVVLGVTMDAGSPDRVRRFLEERNITYPVAMATSQVVRDFGGVPFLPTSYLIDRDGRIRNEVRGMFTSVALEQAVERLLREPYSSRRHRSGEWSPAIE
jgi:peroxiredoxin